ncbi:hypothetical protein TEQG_06313 [Trichophyton equinum CBS 127.97]|uniref:Uncharacterized protein n=1 Tax=Trichophyton equinum (strain ATCC MYA-4606 / CBS 127.97) TaxID=559882 RepID=F2PZC2_TRIEC|nr:hypothetical protein TEQG_06313 [Trichophyton equinum CBS 127.97]
MDSPNNRTAGYLQRSCKTGKFQASTTSKQQTAMQGIHGWIDAKKRLIKSEKKRQARNGELRRTGEMSVAWIIEAALSLLSAGCPTLRSGDKGGGGNRASAHRKAPGLRVCRLPSTPMAILAACIQWNSESQLSSRVLFLVATKSAAGTKEAISLTGYNYPSNLHLQPSPTRFGGISGFWGRPEDEKTSIARKMKVKEETKKGKEKEKNNNTWEVTWTVSISRFLALSSPSLSYSLHISLRCKVEMSNEGLHGWRKRAAVASSSSCSSRVSGSLGPGNG